MHHLALDAEGNVLVADTWNNRVRKIDARTGIIHALIGTGRKAYSGDGGAAIRAECGGIYCLSVDLPRQRLVLADLDNRRVRSVSLDDGTIRTLAGNGQRGVPADGSLAAESPLVDPRAVACDSLGNVYILERSGHALRVVDAQGRVRTVAGTGSKGPCVDDVAARETTLNGPKHLCVDSHDDVLIADSENHVIRKLLVREARVVRVAGTGKPGDSGLNGPPLNVELRRPHGVFVDRRGILFIADSENNRVLKVERP
jgi:DNA-binding beta-propeller fold protein YncE